MEGRNLALLGGFAWRAQEDNRPWARVIQRKYSGRRVIGRSNNLNRRAFKMGNKGVHWDQDES